MKLHAKNNRKLGAFTLIEMIGVLAVIAILAAVLIPKVFEAINNSRINNAAMSCQTIKTALANHYAKYGSIPYDGSLATPAPITALPYTTFDTVLLKEQLTDKLFDTKISTANDGAGGQTSIQLINLTGAKTTDTIASAAAAFAKGEFNLDGDAGALNDCTGSCTAVAVLTGVTMGDAWNLSKRIDGDGMSQPDATTADLKGRVIYDVAGAAGTTTVYIYLTHR